jgi:hypothetical protein
MVNGQILTSTRPPRAQDIIELQREAAEARRLSAFFRDPAAIRDLKNYAFTLERVIADAKDYPEQLPLRKP